VADLARGETMIKLDVASVENLNFFLQLLQHASVLVKDFEKIWAVVLERNQQCLRYSF